MRQIFFAALLSVAASTAYASCDGLPPASHEAVFEPAHSYATTGDQTLSDDGLVMFDYGKEYNNLGKWPNPFFNALYAHTLYRDWLRTGCTDDSLKDKFLRHAEWYDKIHKEKDGMAVWTYPFRNSYFNVDAGWYSGIGQAQIAGILFRAYSITKDKKFEKLAKQALEVYFRPMSKGGVVTYHGDDIWIQEIPDPAGKPFNVLNGHITGVTSLIDVSKIHPDKRIDDVIKRAVNAVRHDIQSYDAGFTSFYARHLLNGKYAHLAERGGYNNLHVRQLLTLYEFDGDPVFLDYTMRFQAYENVDDERTAKGSSDPKGHGPKEAAAFYPEHYWSHNVFPTWYAIKIEPSALIEGIYLEGVLEESMPKDFSVSAYLDDVKHEIATVVGNTDRQLYLRFKRPLRADKIVIDIQSDNGNQNVALTAIMPIRSQPIRAPITNLCNHRNAYGSYLIKDAFDDDPKTRFTIRCDGYVTLPKIDTTGVLSIGSVEEAAPVKVKISDDLRNWKDLGAITPSKAQTLKVPANVYTRIDLPMSLGSIDGIKLEGVASSSIGVEKTPFRMGVIAHD